LRFEVSLGKKAQETPSKPVIPGLWSIMVQVGLGMNGETLFEKYLKQKG
jgi:hypothetical protein